MCRIAGIINKKSSEGLKESILKMTNAMARGGPDDDGIFIDEELNVCLGHRRLSIIDLSSFGHQPMIEKDLGLTISFNGEIYNYLELKKELIKLNYTFKSNSDTEVILIGYNAWGVDLFNKLKGMFAFIIFDRKKKQIIAARDHAGIKPLYYGDRDGKFYFSSEIRGIKAANTSWPDDENWPIRFLTFGFIPEPFSTLHEVFHLPKGSFLVYDLIQNEYKINKYINFTFSSKIKNIERAIKLTRETLLESVQRHLVADVPVGIFLSGGIDSSLLTYACRKFNKNQIKTLSIYFDDEKYSEKYFQDLVAKDTGVSHTSFLVTQKDFEESLPDIFEAMDQPSIDGINSYFITKYAKEYGLKVVLSGLGADELFGGYSSFYNSKFEKIKRIRWATKLVSLIFQKYPTKKIQFLKKRDGLEEYLFNRGLFVPEDVAKILHVSEKKVWDVINQNGYKEWLSLSTKNRASAMEQNLYMQNQLLRDSDIYSMWHSVELRVPFLDVDIMKLAHAIDSKLKFHSTQKKYLLIEAFKEELPREIWDRKKMGFTFPFQKWFKDSKYLTNIELKSSGLKKTRHSFDNGTLNWSRYWAQVVVNDKAPHII